jgi:hypothetical protein
MMNLMLSGILLDLLLIYLMFSGILLDLLLMYLMFSGILLDLNSPRSLRRPRGAWCLNQEVILLACSPHYPR